MVLVGCPPPAVGTLSTYWLIAEFPGGAILRTRALPAAGKTSMISTAAVAAFTTGHTPARWLG
jgi:hypothetical protein